MIVIIVIVLIVGLCVWLFGNKDKGTNIKCDHCGYSFNLHKAGYDQFQLSGKKCPKCGNCVNKKSF